MNWKTNIKSLIFAFLWIGANQMVWAGEPDTNQIAAIKTKIETLFTDVKVDNVTTSPIDGLYQVTAGPLVLYATKDGRYAVTGDVVDLNDGQLNITEQARKKARIQALEKLGEQNMIVFSPDKPKATVTVFTDIDCGYCRKLHAQISKMNELGIKVRYLAFPRTGPNSRSFDKAVAVWCSKNPAEALTLAKQGKEIEEKSGCDKKAVIEKQFNFALLTGVMGTPTFILEDGTLIPGYLPPERLAELTEQIKGH
ncbi:MAG: DsbC family protein [Gammaproteobacteria bacterium]